ncbi:MAG: hypothetical protein ACP5U1_04225 [Desulfomonilaceae bacterium]
MRKLWLGILATLPLIVCVAPAFAWDFSMRGQFEWRYRYFGRANGYQDLFGDMRLQDNPTVGTQIATATGPIGFAGPNFYRGYNGSIANPMGTSSQGMAIRIVRGGFAYADSDGSAQDQRMTFDPQLRINKAIRFRANVDFSSIRQKYNHRDFETSGPMDRWYQNRMSQNAFDTAMLPSVNMWHITAQLPWGVISGGARDFPWGTGAMGGFNTRNDGLLFVAPYGPFRFIFQIYFANWPDGYGTFTPYVTSGPVANSVVNLDNGEHNNTAWALAMTYDSGPLSFGLLGLQRLLHSNNVNLEGSVLPVAPELGLASTPYRIVYPNPKSNLFVMYGFGGFDLAMAIYNANMKYNNGRFFLNAEYAWANVDTYFLGVGSSLASRPGATYSGGPQYDTEASMAFLETGALCGPAKFAFMFAWSGGLAVTSQKPRVSPRQGVLVLPVGRGFDADIRNQIV